MNATFYCERNICYMYAVHYSTMHSMCTHIRTRSIAIYTRMYPPPPTHPPTSPPTYTHTHQPGTLMQLIAVIILTVGYIAVLCYSRPYADQVDDRMAITNQLMLFLTLVGALMVKVNSVLLLVGTLFSHAQFLSLHSYSRCRMASPPMASRRKATTQQS